MLYRLLHTNVLLCGDAPCGTDDKLIGHYSSLERALEARERCADLRGFCDFPEGFRIELVLPGETGEARDDVRYAVSYCDLSDPDADVELWIGGYFLTPEAARRELKRLSKLPQFTGARENLEVCEIHVNRDHWQEGFDSCARA